MADETTGMPAQTPAEGAQGSPDKTAATTPENPGTTAETPAEPERKFTQADLDRERQRASETARKNALEAAERKRAEEANDFKAIAETERTRREQLELAIATRDAMQTEGTPEVTAFFERDVSTVDGRVEFARAYKAAVKAAAKALVDSTMTNKTPEASIGLPATPKTPDQMSTEEYLAYKREKGIY